MISRKQQVNKKLKSEPEMKSHPRINPGSQPGHTDNPDNLLHRDRVKNFFQPQPGHHREQGPESLLTCSFFPNASIAASAFAFIA